MLGNFEIMVYSNQIQNSPINSKDITNSKVIFGPHLEGGRGKTLIIHTNVWIVIVWQYRDSFNSSISRLPWLPMYYL